MASEPISWMALSAVSISLSEKHAMAWVVNWAAGKLQPSLNLDHCLRKSAHWADQQPMSTVGRTRAGGLRLDSRVLGGIWAGWSATTWLMIACMAAAASRQPGAWKRQSPNMQARAMAKPKAQVMELGGQGGPDPALNLRRLSLDSWRKATDS